jgi:hypothetical protein
MNRRIKNIFTHSYNTGELYLTKKENNKIVRVEILVRVVNEKKDWVVSEFLLPNEDSMVSMCIGGCGQSVFVVARSPVYVWILCYVDELEVCGLFGEFEYD